MASARYWRVLGVRPYGTGALELTELQLWAAGARVDAGVTPTATIAPASGTVADLSDGSFATGATWAAADYRANGFFLLWVFPSAVTVDSILVGTASTKAASLRQLEFAYSDDGLNWSGSTAALSVPYTDPNIGVLVSPAAYRFWSLYITKWVSNGSENSTGQVRVAEMRLLSAAGALVNNVPLTSDTTPAPYAAFASSTLAGIYPAYAAFDGGLGDNSRWISQAVFTGPERLTLDMGAPVEASVLKLAPDTEVYVGLGYYITEFQLQVSNTGAFAGEQTVLGSWSNLPQSNWSPGSLTSFAFGTVVSDPPDGTSVALLGFANSPMPAFGGGRDMGVFARVRNFETDGNGVISGTVAILGDPTNMLVRRRVRLLRDKDAVLVAEVWSNATTGAFSFPAIDRTQKYIVLTDDYEASYRAVVADRITPELMP